MILPNGAPATDRFYNGCLLLGRGGLLSLVADLVLVLVLVLVMLPTQPVEAFIGYPSHPVSAAHNSADALSRCGSTHQQKQYMRVRRPSSHMAMNFFKDMLDQAFQNDDSLSQEDKRLGSMEGPGSGNRDEDDDSTLRLLGSTNRPGTQRASARPGAAAVVLTETQRSWRQQMDPQPRLVSEHNVIDTVVSLDLFLTGVPSKDPSNDLFGQKSLVSLRDRKITGGSLIEQQQQPNLSLDLQFLANGKCRVVPHQPLPLADNDDNNNDTTAPTLDTTPSSIVDQNGDWMILSNEATKQQQILRFRVLLTTGYTRRVETVGTIQKIYGSSSPSNTGNSSSSSSRDRSSVTSTEYSIPPGWLYGEATISISNKKSASADAGLVQWDNNSAVLKVQKIMGLLGAGSVLIPCGKFRVSRTEQ
jgi:hypothetical protein